MQILRVTAIRTTSADFLQSGTGKSVRIVTETMSHQNGANRINFGKNNFDFNWKN